MWDEWGNEMNTFWNSYCVAPWLNWSAGDVKCKLATPSQQAQESWHKQLKNARIPGMMKGSTHYVFNTTLPHLIQMDALLSPDELCYEVPCIPTKMMEKVRIRVNQRRCQ